MTGSGDEPLTATVEAHGVAFELRASGDGGGATIAQDEFQKYVNRVTRMLLGFTQAEAETLRDELLILDGLGKGVRLDSLADQHPFSVSAANAESVGLGALIRIRAFDPVLNPKTGRSQ